MAEPPAFATIPETCATLRISRATCCRWIENGRLEAVKLGHAVRIKTASILALAA
ncbi:helix-turn-helix domain-containing protein [Acidiphilium sp.]|uniref:helix-turn-helix domain-containing protein n=1 Tax=Acidiphilium sp. TaxID=527 RepID=UPI00258B9DD1|nr:helix-turn-helix domain-containing protein [Acidiphilium sp.]